MECKVKCKSCQQIYSIDLLAEYCGKIYSFSCPHCNVVGTLKVTPELLQKVEMVHKQNVTNKPSNEGVGTYVPGVNSGNGNPSRNTGSVEPNGTYIPGLHTETPQKLKLVVCQSKEYDTPNQCFVLDQDYNMVGRKNFGSPQERPDIEIVTNDKYMSRKHCLIKNNGYGRFSIEDHGSANGTYVNCQRLECKESVYLNDGDVIQMGRTEIKVSFK